MPVILVGDFNSTPESAPYNQLASAGFLDAASEEDEEGFTCCHASDLQNEKSTLSVRIDQVHFRGILRSEDVRLIGHRRRDRTASGLWPSDHGGIIVKLILGQIGAGN